MTTLTTANASVEHPNNTESELTDWDSVIRRFQEQALFTHKNPFTIVLILLYSIAFLIGFIGNTLVIVVVVRHRSMRTLTNTFLVNLAIGDLMVIVICVPMTLGRYVYKNWIYGETMCKLTPFIQGVSVSVSVLTLLAIGLDRYFAITKPMKARIIFSKRKVKFMLVAIWTLSVIMFSPFLVVNSTMKESFFSMFEVIHCREHWQEAESKQSYNLIIFTTLYVVPLILLTAAYIRTGTILWYGDRRVHKQDEMSLAQVKVLRGRQRVVKMLISIVVLFAVSWLPYHVINIWMDFEFDGDNTSSMSAVADYAYPMSQWLGLANSASNPLCYCFMSKSFRNAFLAVFKCRESGILVSGSTVVRRTTPARSHLRATRSVSSQPSDKSRGSQEALANSGKVNAFRRLMARITGRSASSADQAEANYAEINCPIMNGPESVDKISTV